MPGEISAYKLASALNKDFESVSEYLRILQQAGLVNALFSDKTGKAMMHNPIKMYPDNTNLIYSAMLPQTDDALIGKLRETFVVNQINSAGLTAYYADIGDIKVADYYFDVGGKNKTAKQLKNNVNGYVLADGISAGWGKTIPLYLMGFLY